MNTHPTWPHPVPRDSVGGRKPRLVYIVNWDWYFRVHWLERAKAAKQHGYDVWVLVPNTNQAEIDRIRDAGFPVIETTLTRKGLNPLKELMSLAQLFRILISLSPNLIHNVTIKPNLYGSYIARIKAIPTINSVTGLGFTFASQSMKGRLLRTLLSYLCWTAWNSKRCRLLFENPDDRKLLISRGIVDESRTKIIPGAGVDIDLYKYHKEPDLTSVRILFAGRILWDKGIHDLVKASEIMIQRGLPFELIVAGIVDSGNLSVVPESAIRDWHSRKLINWIGYQEDMPELIKSVHIVALPTFYGEGIPRILIEAASMGRAVVATDVPGCREIVKHEENGLLVAPKDPQNLAQALERLITRPDLRIQMGLRGREIVMQSFAQRIVIEKTLRVYREALEDFH